MKVIFEQYAALNNIDRPQADVNADCAKAWKVSPVQALRLIIVISKHNKGEGIKRWLWLAMTQPDTFSHNVHKVVSTLGYEGLISLLYQDIAENGWENRTKIIWHLAKIAVILGLNNPRSFNRVLLALPKIQSSDNESKSIMSGIGKFFAITFFGKSEHEKDYSSYRKYRKMCNGTVSYISTIKYQVDPTKCNRRVLAMLSGSGKAAKVDYNYTGSIFDLFAPYGYKSLPQSVWSEDIIRMVAHFDSFIANCKKVGKPNNALVVADLSASTEGRVQNLTSYYIGKCLAIMYGTLNCGYFHNKYAVFTDKGCEVKTLVGSTGPEMWEHFEDIVYSQHNTLDKVLNMFKSHPDLEPSEYPSDIIIVSDGGFEIPGPSYQKFINDLATISPEYAKRVKVLILNIPNSFSSVTPINKEGIPANITYVNAWEPANMWALSAAGGIYKPFNDNLKAKFYAEMERPDVMDTQVIIRKKSAKPTIKQKLINVLSPKK